MWIQLAEQCRQLLGDGRAAEALSLAQNAVAAAEQREGKDHQDVAAALTVLGEVQFLTGAVEPAAHSLARAVHIDHHARARARLAEAATLELLGQVHEARGDNDHAADAFRRAIAAREEIQGPQHPDIAVALLSLALLKSEGAFDDQAARPLLERAVKLLEGSTVREQRARLAVALHNLAVIAARQDRLFEAESLLRQAELIQREIDSPFNPALPALLCELAQVQDKLGRPQSAEELFREAVAIADGAFGPSSEAGVPAIVAMAAHYEARAMYPQAIALYERAREIQRRAEGPDDIDAAEIETRLSDLRNWLRRKDELAGVAARA